jgi:four helix bundle protein
LKRIDEIVNRESLQRESAPKQPRERSTFEDLEVYRVAREFRKAMYSIAKRLPEVEKFGLANQIRRAAVSVTNNIAEGQGRYHYLDRIKFTLHSRGSLEELTDDLNVCEDEQYLPADQIASLKEDGWRVRQLIDGYLRYLRRQRDSARGLSSMREASPDYGEEIDDSRFSI